MFIPLMLSRIDLNLTDLCTEQDNFILNFFCFSYLKVHDELIFEVRTGLIRGAAAGSINSTCSYSSSWEVQAVGRIVRECMEGAVVLNVPLSVKLSAGETWGSLQPLNLGEVSQSEVLQSSALQSLSTAETAAQLPFSLSQHQALYQRHGPHGAFPPPQSVPLRPPMYNQQQHLHYQQRPHQQQHLYQQQQRAPVGGTLSDCSTYHATTTTSATTSVISSFSSSSCSLYAAVIAGGAGGNTAGIAALHQQVPIAHFQHQQQQHLFVAPPTTGSTDAAAVATMVAQAHHHPPPPVVRDLFGRD